MDFSFKNQRKQNLERKKKFGDKKYKSNKNHNNYNNNPKSTALINVYLDTKKYFENTNTEKSILYDISLVNIDKELLVKPKYDCKIIIKNQDSLDMALDFIKICSDLFWIVSFTNLTLFLSSTLLSRTTYLLL